jgi:pimeloyl-ACP methyl ester carboxylesterase
VSQVVPWEGTEVAVTLVIPDDAAARRRTLAVGFPGGGYSRGYWDIAWREGYSEAEYHAERGWLFAAVDHLGVGASSLPDPAGLTFEVLAAANDAAVRSLVEGLRAGTLAEGLGPVDVASVIGLGQSMGGCLSIVAQARHGTFDALAVLGYSAIHTVLPSPSGGIQATPVERGTAPLGVVEASTSELGGLDTFRYAFHWDDVEPGLLAADLAGGYPIRSGSPPQWGSSTIPPAAVSMLTPGVVAGEASSIEVPVFVGVGERDVCPDPWAEPGAYRSSSDITLVIVSDMAHMHNFAGSRRELWRRLQSWGDGIDGSRR